MRYHTLIRGDWDGFGLWLEPATPAAGPSRLVQTFNTLTGAARAAARVNAWLAKEGLRA